MKQSISRVQARATGDSACRSNIRLIIAGTAYLPTSTIHSSMDTRSIVPGAAMDHRLRPAYASLRPSKAKHKTTDASHPMSIYHFDSTLLLNCHVHCSGGMPNELRFICDVQLILHRHRHANHYSPTNYCHVITAHETLLLPHSSPFALA